MSEEQNTNQPQDGVSRRNFLITAGTLAAGLAAGGVFGSIAPNKAEGAATPIPWPYIKLDPEVVRKKGFDSYYEGGCCYGAAKALIAALQEALPDSPWHNIPVDMFKYGAGGALSWGTLCGALNGSLAVMNLATTSYSGIGNELIGWYTLNSFPSKLLDGYTTYKNQIQTVANSPLCHNSVSIWCEASGKTVNSTDKKARCAKLTGDTAAKAAQLLTALLIDKNFVAAFKFDPETQTCMDCHTTTTKYDNEQGKMACNDCHEVVHDHNTFADDECIVCHK